MIKELLSGADTIDWNSLKKKKKDHKVDFVKIKKKKKSNCKMHKHLAKSFFSTHTHTRQKAYYKIKNKFIFIFWLHI